MDTHYRMPPTLDSSKLHPKRQTQKRRVRFFFLLLFSFHSASSSICLWCPQLTDNVQTAIMSLVAMVYYVLLAQCVVLTMLCLPYLRNVITYLGRFIPGV